MKTLVKHPHEQIIEKSEGSTCHAFRADWVPGYKQPYWARWGKPKTQYGTVVHLRHLPSAILAPPVAGTVDDPPANQRFEDLASQWEAETEFMSRQSQTVMHPAYQQIIGMGPAAVPLLLERLRDNPDNWFWALTAITGEDPGKDSSTLLEAREAWLQWGRERGFLD
ncbi:MAG TPA: hypothetical protein VFR75_11350 [Solirubrobacterales bacterium]|nr:hypothetical protein [Solirubrobacterales bacterium]